MFPAILIQHGVEFSGVMVRFGTDAFLQSTLLIALGLLAGWVLRTRGAAVQSAVYRITLAAALACPLVAPLLSAAGIPGLHVNLPMPVTMPRLSPTPIDPAPSARTTTIDADRPVARLQREMVPSSVMRPEVHVPSPASGPGVPQPNPADTGISEARPPLDWLPVVACLMAAGWLLGTCVLTVRLLLAWRLAVQLRRSASEADPQTASDCRTLAQRMGIRPPAVLRSPFATSAALVGLFRPAILLPEEESAAASNREILVHELAHLARGDLLWKLLGHVGTALFFFQPLMWHLVRRMIIAAEEVCDDYVLEFGCDRQSYARQLVEVAQHYQPGEAVGVGMISLRSWVGRRVVRILDSSRRLSLRAGRRLIALALAMSLVTTIMVGLFGIAWGQAGAAPANRQTQPAADGPKKAVDHPGDRFEFRGQVLDPDGKPLAGAAVYFIHSGHSDAPLPPPKVQATTGRDGRFRFTLEKASFDTWGILDDTGYNSGCNILARADGYGPVWQRAFAFDASGELARRIRKACPDDAEFVSKKRDPLLRLVKDDVPLVGRIVDTKGQPVAGVKVGVRVIERVENEDLTGWLNTAEKKDADVMALMTFVSRKYRQSISVVDNMLASNHLPAAMPTATSDADGRFRLTGIGRERLVWLSIEGARIEAACQVWVRTRPGPTLVLPFLRLFALEQYTYYGATFEHVARPALPIVGTVRDKDSGKPLAGVTIQPYKLSGNPGRDVGLYVRTTSDAAGHYRLPGVPIGRDNELLAVPTTDQPYLRSKRRADTTAGKDSLGLDFALKRGIWIRGRITDAQSGVPVPGCIVNYFVLRNNPYWKSAPGFEGDYQHFSRHADQDGRYAVVGLPGPGIVTVQVWGAGRTRYWRRAGQEDIPELRHAGEAFDRVAPGTLHTQHMHALAKVDPADGVESIEHDFRLDPGQTLTGAVLDAAGKPLAGAHYSGSTEVAREQSWDLLGSDTFTVNCYRADKPRTLLFVHLARKLAGSLSLKGVQPGRLSVRLQPWGAITGWVVDADGKPMSGITLLDASNTLPTSLLGKASQGVFPGHSYRVGGDGRFCIEGLAPGVKHSLMAVWDDGGNEHRHLGPLATDMVFGTRKLRASPLIPDATVASGQTKDLGDLHFGRVPEYKWLATPAKAKKAPAPAADAPGITAASGKKQQSRPEKEFVVWERPRGNCSISGKVVSATTGKPVARARMYLYYVRSPSAILIDAARDGTFEFKDIPEGPFSLQSLNTPGCQDAHYDPEGEPGSLRQFTLADGEHRSGIVLKVQEACRISGKILDENGKVPERVGRFTVLAWFQNDDAQKYEWKGWNIDGKDGSYQIDGLSGKPVYVMATNWRAAIEGNARPPIYYPGTFFRSDAKQITFDKSRSVEHVDIRLRREGGLILAGTVRDEAGKPVPEAFVVVHRRDMLDDFVTAYTDAQGRYQVQGLGDGDFLVHVDAVHRGLVRTRTPIDLDKTSRKTELNFTLARGATISGKLVDENGHDWQVARSDGRAMTNINNGSGGFTPTDADFRNKYRPKNSDGIARGSFALGEGDYDYGEMIFPTKSTFIIQGLMPGHATFQFSPQKVTKILHGGRDILESGIDTEPGKEIKNLAIVIGKQ